jgi:hypothetical protein
LESFFAIFENESGRIRRIDYLFKGPYGRSDYLQVCGFVFFQSSGIFDAFAESLQHG